MGNSEESRYSQEFVDGVINDYNEWKKNNNQRIVRIPADNPNTVPANDSSKASVQDAMMGNRRNVMPLNGNTMTSMRRNRPIREDEMTELSAYAPVNPGIQGGAGSVAPVNNTQRVAGRELIFDRNSDGKQRTLQINNNQNSGNGTSDREERDIFGKTGKDYKRFSNSINYGPNGMAKNVIGMRNLEHILSIPYHIAKSPEYYENLKKKTLQINNNKNAGNGASKTDDRDIFGKNGKDYDRLWRQINCGPNGMQKQVEDLEKLDHIFSIPYHIAKSPEYYEYLKKRKSGR
jgi:hypothetical protein